jgi:hypothetical protein
VESAENQTQVSHSSHRPLKIPQRDFHISTAPAMTIFTEPNQRKEVGRCAASPSLAPALPLVGGPYFMLILRLENAEDVGCPAQFAMALRFASRPFRDR